MQHSISHLRLRWTLVPILLLVMAACGRPIKLGQQGTKMTFAVPIETLAHLSIVDIYLNGAGPYKFILDTGAGVTVLNSSLAAKLDIPVVGTVEVGSPMGSEPIVADSLFLMTLRLGDVVVENPSAISMDLDDMLGGLGHIDGVLSADAFDGYLLTIDFPRNEVRLEKGALPESGAGIISYVAWEGVPTILISVGTVAMTVALDTGMPSTLILQSDYISRLTLTSEPTVVGQGRSVDATFDILSSELNGSITFGEISITNPRISFTEHTTQGTMGMEVLGNYALTIDRANRRIKFGESAGSHAQVGGPRRMVRRGGRSGPGYGIQLSGITGDVLTVRGVVPGRPAATAGLQGGDQIVAMNGEPLASLSRAERMTHLRGSTLVLTVVRDSATIELELSLE